MNEMEVSISDLLAVLVRKGKQIVIICVAFAILLGAYKGFTLWRALQDKDRLDLAQLEYEQEVTKLERAIEKAEEDAAKKEDYLENSLWMKIDPYNKYVASLYLSIANVDEYSLNMSFGDNETPVEYLTRRISNQYSILWSSLDLPSELGVSRYEDVLDKYVREVVSMRVMDGGILHISAIGNSEAEAKEAADAVYTLLKSLSDVVCKNSYFHSLEEFNYVLKNQIDIDMADAQTAEYKQLDSYNDTMIEAENALKLLKAPEGMLTAVIKMVIVGGVAGSILACAWYCLKSLLQGRLQSSSQMANLLNISCIGSICKKQDMFGKIGDVFAGERTWKDEKQALDYIAETVKMRANSKNILLASSLELETYGEAVQKLKDTLSASGETVDVADDVTRNSKAVSLIQKCDAVILVEAVDETKLSQVQEILKLVQECDKQVIGFVMV